MEFRKPFLESDKKSFFPYSEELLKNHPIFPLYIMDGGAKFFADSILGADWDGDKMAEAVMNGSLFKKWEGENGFDWDLPYKQFCQSNVPAPLEWFVWINRLYFLIPLANMFFKTGEEKYIEKWYECFEDWWDKHPYIEMQDDDIAIKKSVWSDDKNISQTVAESEGYIQSLVWRDMQVTWRLLAVIHSIAMMSDSKTLTQDKWEKIYDFIKLHASQLLIEGKKYSEMESLHNHVLQMGLALVYIGCLFPEFEDSDEYLKRGKKVIEIQLKGAVDADGGSNETCISYSHFIARYYVECYLLLEKNNKSHIKGLLESIKKQYEWMYQMSTPKGRTLIFNDAYSLPALEDIEIAKKLIPLNLNEKSSVVFKNSKCGVFRNEQMNLYFDAMDFKQVHQHAGRPNFVLYCNDNPLVVDSGCTGYDNHGIHKYLLAEWAHNTVCVYRDDTIEKNVKFYDEVTLDGCGENFVEFSVKGERQGISFLRKRKIELKECSAVITDEVELSEEGFIESRLHLASLDLTQNGNTVYVHKEGTNKDIKISATGENINTTVDYKPVINEEGNFAYSPVISAKTRAIKTTIKFEVNV